MNSDTLPLRVMSFNIRTETARDLRFSWDLRKHLVIERIQAHDPDLLGLQECHDGEQAVFVREQLAEYAFLGVRRGEDSRTGREMAPILYRRSRFELLDSGHFWLSSTPERAGSKMFGAIFPRTVSWAKLRPREASERPLFFFNTHFDYMPLIMAASARILRRQMEEISGQGPTVVCGDFNTPTGGKSQRILAGTEPSAEPARYILQDAGAAAQSGVEALSGTIHKFGRITRPLIIDWILASEHFTILEGAIDTYEDNGLYPSDHFPVTATLLPRM